MFGQLTICTIYLELHAFTQKVLFYLLLNLSKKYYTNEKIVTYS